MTVCSGQDKENKMRDATHIDDVFSYHAPTDEQVKSYEQLRAAAKEFARVILHECPACADRTDALRKVREAVMTANAAIALAGKI
jgi:hypothetical protein